MVTAEIDDSYLEELDDTRIDTNNFIKLKQDLKKFVDTDEFKERGYGKVALKIRGEVKIYQIKEVK